MNVINHKYILLISLFLFVFFYLSFANNNQKLNEKIINKTIIYKLFEQTILFSIPDYGSIYFPDFIEKLNDSNVKSIVFENKKKIVCEINKDSLKKSNVLFFKRGNSEIYDIYNLNEIQINVSYLDSNIYRIEFKNDNFSSKIFEFDQNGNLKKVFLRNDLSFFVRLIRSIYDEFDAKTLFNNEVLIEKYFNNKNETIIIKSKYYLEHQYKQNFDDYFQHCYEIILYNQIINNKLTKKEYHFINLNDLEFDKLNSFEEVYKNIKIKDKYFTSEYIYDDKKLSKCYFESFTNPRDTITIKYILKEW